VKPTFKLSTRIASPEALNVYLPIKTLEALLTTLHCQSQLLTTLLTF
jgi:hypothetical protein